VRRGQHLFAVRVRVASYLVYPPFPDAVVDLLSEGPKEVVSGVVLDMRVTSLHPSAAFLGAIKCDKEDARSCVSGQSDLSDPGLRRVACSAVRGSP